MGTSLNDLKPAQSSVKTKSRLGRGAGSGSGGTASRGHKGAKSRSGYARKIGFEGGQMPLQRRVPKFGFTNRNRKRYRGINLSVLQDLISRGKVQGEIHPEALIQNGLAHEHDSIKILGEGTLEGAVSVRAHKFSKSAREAITKAGGQAITL